MTRSSAQVRVGSKPTVIAQGQRGGRQASSRPPTSGLGLHGCRYWLARYRRRNGLMTPLLPLDDVLADDFHRLLACWCKRLAFLRFDPCLRFVGGLELSYTDTLRRITKHRKNFVADDESATSSAERFLNL